MAGFISKDTIEQIRNALDITDLIGTYIQVKRTGSGKSLALCPFHKEKTPSLHINSARQAFHCFGCGVGGDIFKFVMLYEHVEFPTALRMLAERAGIILQHDEHAATAPGGPRKDEIFAANENATQRYQHELIHSPEAAPARTYLQTRALDPAIWPEWGIGYAPDRWGFLADSAGPRDSPKMLALEAAGLIGTSEKGTQYDRFRGRIMFTIRDELARPVGFSGRLLKPDEKAGGKYVNTPETPVFRKSKILFALDKAKREILDRHQAILVEGQIDCIRCHLGGFPNTIASQGTAFTTEHATLLKRYADHILVVLDSDTAGEKAALRSATLLIEEGLVVSLATLPPGEDPDTLILKQGPAAFAAILRHAKTPMGFLVETLRKKEDFRTQEGLLRATRAAIELAGHAQSAVQSEQMLREAATALNISYEALRRDLRAALRKHLRPAAPEPTTDTPAPIIRPVDEVELITLLATGDPILSALIRQWLPYEHLTDPDCRAILRALAEEEGNLFTAIEDERDPCKALAAQIVNAPQKTISTEADMGPAKAVQDIILRLWKRHLEQQRETLTQQIKTQDGPTRTASLQALAELLHDLNKLKLGWPTAHPILDHHLKK